MQTSKKAGTVIYIAITLLLAGVASFLTAYLIQRPTLVTRFISPTPVASVSATLAPTHTVSPSPSVTLAPTKTLLIPASTSAKLRY